MLKKISLALAVMTTGVQAAPRFMKGCPKDVKAQSDFDLERYMGTWYEIVRDKTTPFELLQNCVYAEYGANRLDIVTVINSGYRPVQGWSHAYGEAVRANAGDASLVVSFDGHLPS